MSNQSSAFPSITTPPSSDEKVLVKGDLYPPFNFNISHARFRPMGRPSPLACEPSSSGATLFQPRVRLLVGSLGLRLRQWRTPSQPCLSGISPSTSSVTVPSVTPAETARGRRRPRTGWSGYRRTGEHRTGEYKNRCFKCRRGVVA